MCVCMNKSEETQRWERAHQQYMPPKSSLSLFLQPQEDSIPTSLTHSPLTSLHHFLTNFIFIYKPNHKNTRTPSLFFLFLCVLLTLLHVFLYHLFYCMNSYAFFSLSLLSETPKQNSFLQLFSTISPTTFPSLFLLVIPTLFCLFISNTLLYILSPNTIIIYQSFNNLHCAIITLIKAWEKVTSFNQMVHSKSLFFRPPQTLLKHLLGKEQKVIFCSLEIVGVKN